MIATRVRSLRAKSRVKDSLGDKIFIAVVYLLLLLVFLAVCYPLLYIVSASFSSPQAVSSGKVWLLPVDPCLDGYKAVFENKNIVNGYINSIFITVVGTIHSVALTVMAGYPLSRKEFAGGKLIMGLFTFTLMFSGGMIPGYLLMKNLNLLNTRWALILPGAARAYYVILACTFFRTSIPKELYEAAELDGASDFRVFFSVVLPLSKSILAVLALYYAVGYWNSYFSALLYLRDTDLFPLQVILRNILLGNQINAEMISNADQLVRSQGLVDLLKYSLIVVASAPILILYPFVQKYFIKGVMIGSIKG